MPPLLLPTHPPTSLEGNGGIPDTGLAAKVEGIKGAGSERGSPIEKYMRPSKPSSYSPPGSPIEKYQYPLFSLPLPLTLSPDFTPESDWLRFWTKYKMAATSGVAGGISNLSNAGSLGNNAHYLGAMVSPVQQHQSYTVPYCASPYSPLPPPPAAPHYPTPPLLLQTSSNLENEAPLDLATKQRETNGRKPESPVMDKNWKEDEDKMDVAEIQNEEESTKSPLEITVKRTTAEVSTQDDLTHRCTHCAIYFLDEVMYALHMSCHGDQGPFQCSFCLHMCADRYDFTTHIQRGLHRNSDKQKSQESKSNITVISESANIKEKSDDENKDINGTDEEEEEEEENKGSGSNDDQDGGTDEPVSKVAPDCIATSPDVTTVSKSKKSDENSESHSS